MLLGRLLEADPLSDPFASEWVVLGNKGLEDWLARSLAETLGVCANVRFPFSMGFLGRALGSLEAGATGGHTRFGAEPAPDPWQIDTLTWAVLATFPAFRNDDRFVAVNEWLSGGHVDPRAPTRRGYTLARRVAAAFDRVLVYRPERALAWSQGQGGGPLPPDLAWQPPLWAAVQKRLSSAHGEARHLAARVEQLPSLLQRPLPADFPRRVSVFGLSTLPPLLLHALARLGRVIDVNLLLLHPSDAIWERRNRQSPASEDEERSLLLGAFGDAFRDFQEQIVSLPEELEDRTALSESEMFLPPERRGTQLLQRLQQDVFVHTQSHRIQMLTRHEEGRLVAADDSVRLHACHGPTRQVEVLRDALLGLLADHPHLQPRDVLVLTPDMDTFAPLVSAVFGRDRALGGVPSLPVRLEDQSARRTNPVATALLALLDLVESRLTLSSAIDLLALEPVREAFGVQAEEVPGIAGLLESAGVRWGADGAWRGGFGQPDDDHNTWKAGLDRIALGAAMADDWSLVAGTSPLDSVEGGTGVLAGKALAFGEILLDAVGALRAPRSLQDWVDLLVGFDETAGLLGRLVSVPESEGWLLERTRGVLLELREQAELASVQTPVGLTTLRSHLEGRFEVPGANPRMPGGAVTFAALRPMRAVPHRVIVLLGMDEGSLPRERVDLRFDLCVRQPRTGDQDPRKEDRASFLEALLAAREHLLVLYTGRDPQTDEPRPPAGPVAELLEVVDQTAVSVVTRTGSRLAPSVFLTTVHPLQAFSPQAFRPLHLPPLAQPGARRSWSFDPELCAAARVLAREVPELEPEPWLPVGALRRTTPPTASVLLEDLAGFSRRPAWWTLRHQLGLHLDERSLRVTDREPLALSSLEQWALRRDLLEGSERGLSADAAGRVLTARGGLPLGRAGLRVLESEAGAVAQAQASLAALHEGAGVRVVPLQVEVAACVLVGSLSVLDAESEAARRVQCVVGAPSARRLVAPFVELLAWTVANKGAPLGVSVVCVHDEGGVLALRVPGKTPQERHGWASVQLASVLDRWHRGQCEVLPIFERTTTAFALAAHKQGVLSTQVLLATPSAAARAAKAAQTTWEGGRGGTGGEGADPLLARAWGAPGSPGARSPWLGRDGTLCASFVGETVRLWSPVLACVAAGASVPLPGGLVAAAVTA